jgi:rod shape determining protein RodA
MEIRWRKYWAMLIAPIDRPFFLLLTTLVLYALMVLASATYDFPERFYNQLTSLGLALIAMRLIAQISPQHLMRLAVPLYLISLILLVAVALFGDVSKGARRWLNLGITRIQPSELMKLAMPLMLAWYLHKHESLLGIKNYFLAALILLAPVILIARQPDLGTAILVLAAGFFVIFLAGLSWRLILPLGGMGLALVLSVIALNQHICGTDINWPGLHDYQKHRICTLMDPESDPLGRGFHIIQSTIAIGSGGILGKGWFKGSQTHLEFLPERHTDFIFAVLAEEFGLLGVAFLLLLYAMLIGRAFVIALNAPTCFARLLSGSIALTWFTYVSVNMGMVSGLVPVVGVPLPFVSYGGTALLTLMAGVGILMSVQNNRTLVQK